MRKLESRQARGVVCIPRSTTMYFGLRPALYGLTNRRQRPPRSDRRKAWKMLIVDCEAVGGDATVASDLLSFSYWIEMATERPASLISSPLAK